MTTDNIVSTEVALVLNPDFGERVIALAQEMPVWVVFSPVNALAVEFARSAFEEGRITTILPRVGEYPSDLFARALYAIDEHHGEASQSVPYSTLWVYGASERMMTPDLAAELGFMPVIVTKDGFRADKG
ncbi:MAG: hypothetical protein PHX38_11095 [Sulfuricella sp.]|nr:hypothetical protein [Sulfuricella sp.]